MNNVEQCTTRFDILMIFNGESCELFVPGLVTIKFKVSRQVLTHYLNQVSSLSLLMTSSSALAHKGPFELTL